MDANKCAYLLVTSPYKPPYTSNDIFVAGGTYDTSAEQVLGPLNEYNDLANGFVTLGPTPATQAPTSSGTDAPTKRPTAQPTRQPTTVPTKQPTTAPTQAPTLRPTFGPTKAPTQFPTFQPPPPGPESPVPLYAGPTRCGPEVALYGSEVFPNGRLLAGQDPKAALEMDVERRELQGGQSDLDLCYVGEKR